MSETVNLISRIALHRQLSNMTYKEVGRRAGTSKEAAWLFFNRPGNYTLKTMFRYCGAVGMKLTVEVMDEGRE